MTDAILQEQIEYYRARAGEYDEWFYRTGRYDHGPKTNQQWFQEAGEVRTQLLQLPHVDHALELASGTGIWTQELLKIANQITAIDASMEMIAINQNKLQSEKVQYIQADLFEWEPDQEYDLVFFSFWLSHVPPDQLLPFLHKVYRALQSGGHLFLIDSQKIHSSTANNHILPEDGNTLKRILNDGREYEIIKVFYEPRILQQLLVDANFSAQAFTTDHYFIYAQATK